MSAFMLAFMSILVLCRIFSFSRNQGQGLQESAIHGIGCTLNNNVVLALWAVKDLFINFQI